MTMKTAKKAVLGWLPERSRTFSKAKEGIIADSLSLLRRERRAESMSNLRQDSTAAAVR